MAEKQFKVIEIGAKVLCILLLILQMALMDYIMISLDTKATPAGRYIWIALDIVIVSMWIVSLIWSYRYSAIMTSPRKIPKDNGRGDEGRVKRIIKAAIAEIRFGYVCWLLYALVLVAKILRMFSSPSGFGQDLKAHDSGSGISFLTPGGIRIVLSMAGIVFGLLIYTHHNEMQTPYYKRVFDCVMIISYLFVEERHILNSVPMEKALKTFGCLCILLPLAPLIALRYISSRQDGKSLVPLVLVLNSASYLFLVNLPFLVIRLVLFAHHAAAPSTFFTKNMMVIVRDSADIYMHIAGWLEERKNNKPLGPEQTESALDGEENGEEEVGDNFEMGKMNPQSAQETVA
ncbi:uncharacterized protein [Amphiura filiformis]|uniref:uncharacterized protein n=1 Tax=Amphiura filiformis TaxID=82378 RepID=UPI003B218B45